MSASWGTFLGSSPVTSSTSPFPVELSQNMDVVAQTEGGGGVSPQLWEASYSTAVSIEDWAVQDVSMPGQQGSWRYYEANVWNSLTQLPGDFNQWYDQMYNDGNVVPLPPLSEGNLSVTNLACWSVPGNRTWQGSQSPLNFGTVTSLTFQFAGFANPEGSGNGHHMIQYWTGAPYEPIPYTMDLVGLTRSSGIGSSIFPTFALGCDGQYGVGTQNPPNPLVSIPYNSSLQPSTCLTLEAWVWLPRTTGTDMKVVGMAGFFTLGIGVGNAGDTNTYRTIYPEFWDVDSNYYTNGTLQGPVWVAPQGLEWSWPPAGATAQRRG